MRLSEFACLVACVLIFNLLIYSLGLVTNALASALFSLVYTLLLIIAVIYLRGDLRAALAITYFFLAIALLFSFSTAGVSFRGVLGPYYVVLISLVSLIPAFAVTKQHPGSVPVHLLIISSLPAALLDATGYAILAASTPFIVLAVSAKDLAIYTASFLSIYVPYALLPALVHNLDVIPHPKALTIVYGTPGSEWNFLLFLKLAGLTYILVGYVQLVVNKKLLPRVKDLRELLIHASASYILGVAAIAAIISGTGVLIKPAATIAYTYLPIAPFTSLALASATGFSRMLREVGSLKANAASTIISLRERLRNYEEALAGLGDLDPIVKRKEYMDKLATYSRSLEDVSTRLSKAILVTPKQLEVFIVELQTLRRLLDDLERTMLTQFLAIVNSVKEVHDRITLITGLRYSRLAEMISSLTEVKKIRELPEAASNLKSVLKELCKVYSKVLDTIVSGSYEVIGLRLKSDAPLACAENMVMIEVLRVYGNLVDEISRSISSDVMSTYTGMVELSRRLKSTVDGLRVLRDSDVVLKLEDVVKRLRSLSELEVTPYRVLLSLTDACSQLKDSLSRLVKSAVGEALHKESLIEGLVAQLGIRLEYLSSYRARLDRSVREYSDYSSRPCKDLVAYLNSTDVLLVREIASYVSALNLALRRAHVLPLLIKYLDDRLLEGGLAIDDIPFSRDVLRWLLGIYLSNRAGVIFDGRVLRREARGPS